MSTVSGKIQQISVFRYKDSDLLSVQLLTKNEKKWKLSLGLLESALPDGTSNRVLDLLDAKSVKLECKENFVSELTNYKFLKE